MKRLRPFVFDRIADSERWWSIVALFFILHVVFVLPILTPNFKDIGLFDEASYIEGGRTLAADLNLPALDESPITAFFFALTYIPVHESDFWFIHSCTIGRFVLFALLWVSSFLLAKRISDISSPLVMVGFLLLSPALSLLIRNGAHALFTAISTFALAQIISFHRRKELTSLWLASSLVSLTFLSRMGEGTFLLVTFIALSILLGMSFRRVRAVVATAVIPVVVIVGGYMLVYYSFTGKSPLGIGEYFYNTFKQGHALAYQDQFPGLNFWVEGAIEADKVFGTREQNKYSVIVAIQNHPTAYLRRVPRLARESILTAIGVYGGPLALWVFFLTLQGCIELMRKKQFILLCILLFWPSYLLIYILLVFQPTHLLLPFPVVFCLAAIGSTSVVSLTNKQRYLWSAMLVGLIAVAVGRDSSLPFISSAVGLLIGLWILWIVLNRYRNLEVVTFSACIFLFSMMLLFRESIPPQQKLRKLGIAPDEQALLFLTRNFEEGTPVGAYAPNMPWAARMKRVRLIKGSVEMQSEQDLQRWMSANNVQAIYVDDRLRRFESSDLALIKSQIGKSLEIAFSSDNEDVQILRTLKASS